MDPPPTDVLPSDPPPLDLLPTDGDNTVPTDLTSLDKLELSVELSANDPLPSSK